ncbi:MAG: cytochrome P450 [Opitutaceae bacterium]|nr:cytochrome P450 [Cephaloticoccus sp.]MCP5529857.1 cytochrome P450 [Opitutaceae bacterium]
MSDSITENADYRAFCEERLQDPYPLFARLRADDPVHWCAPMKLWLVTRYDLCLTALKDERFSSDRTDMYVQALPPDLKARVQPLLDHVAKWIQLTDEPDHTRLRKLVNLAFTPKMIRQLMPRIQGLVDALLDEVRPGEPCDLISQFCQPLPATVICEMLGIPLAERDRFRELVEGIMHFSTAGGPKLKHHAEHAQECLREVIVLFERLVSERRREPRDDLLSALVTAEADGEKLSNDELYAMCVFVFLAGHETTTNGIASGVMALLTHPAQFAKLKADVGAHVRGTVEEALRFESPVTRAVRKAREEIVLEGKTIAPGQLVVFLLGAADRDPAVFPEPDVFDITRSPNKHLAFGFGAHFCLGAVLARMEMEIAFRAIVRRLPQLQLATTDLAWKPTMGIRALTRLPVRVTA